MYNLAKLLSEEPEKLERLGILFLKLLITLLLGSIFLEYEFAISTLAENPIPKEFTLSKFVFYVIILIVIWFIVWGVIADAILGYLLINILSKIGNKKEIVLDWLIFFNVIKKRYSTLQPGKNIIAFNSLLQSYTEEDALSFKENQIRARQYFLVSLANAPF